MGQAPFYKCIPSNVLDRFLWRCLNNSCLSHPEASLTKSNTFLTSRRHRTFLDIRLQYTFEAMLMNTISHSKYFHCTNYGNYMN